MPESPNPKPHAHPHRGDKKGRDEGADRVENAATGARRRRRSAAQILSRPPTTDGKPYAKRWTKNPFSAPPVGYAELHCLTNFSFLRGASHPEELVERAAELGYAALAITDRNSLAGVVRAHLAAKQHNLHLLIGAEITPVDAPPLVLLAPDRPAYGRLSRLITRGRLRMPKGDCAICLQDIADLATGLIAIALPTVAPLAPKSGSPPNPQSSISNSQSPIINRQSSIPQFLRASVPSCLRAFPDPLIPRSLDPFLVYREIFGDHLYLAAELAYDLPDETRLAQLTQLSHQTGIPLIAANNVHYHVPERRYLQDVLTCIREQCTLAEAGPRLFANAERHLRPLDEIARRYAGHPDLLARTVEIAERCTFSLDELRYEYPHELVPEGLTAMEHLKRLTWEGAAEQYGGKRDSGIQGFRDSGKAQRSSIGAQPSDTETSIPQSLNPSIPATVRSTLEAELKLIAELKYEHYFLTVWDLVKFARSRGILCQGRGSAANSAVCYCLGITAVDPTRIDLLFERFISRERNEPPDIDVDFEHERREEIFQYIYKKYGRERAGITAEVITYRPRSAVRDIGKVLGLSLDRIDVLAKSLDWWDAEAVPEEVIRNAGLDPHDRTIQMLVRLVRQLVGFPRHLSQHVGGFVITESPLCEIVPLENAAMPNRTFIEWDKDDIDALGILKVDCLALGMLTAIHKCFKLLGEWREQVLRDLGIEGLRDLGIEGLRKGESHVGETNISRFDRLEKSDCTGKNHLRADEANAGLGTVRVDEPDAKSRRIDRQQHCRGQRAAKPQGLHSLPHRRPRLCGRTGNAANYYAGTQLDPALRANIGSHARNFAYAPGSDQQPAPQGRQKRTVTPQSLRDLPPEDPEVYDMICAADTVGVFQIESRAQMSMLPRLKPRCFYDLVIEVAIVRPGPIQGGMIHPYLRRRNGLEPITYPSEAVKQVLHKTLGVPLFQEQVMRLAVVAAGFTPGEADQLRRAMAAWRLSGSIEKFQLKLIKGMLANGYSKQFAEQIYLQIRGFGEYGFPESHAASFASLVYASAWLKRYHPAAFCAAMLNSQPLGFYTPGQLIRDARAHGVPVRPVDVNFSEWDCTLERSDRGIKGFRDSGNYGALSAEEPRSGKRTSIPQSLNPSIPAHWGSNGPALRLGMRLVRGLSEEKVRGIIAAREEGNVAAGAPAGRTPQNQRRRAATAGEAPAATSRSASIPVTLTHLDTPRPLNPLIPQSLNPSIPITSIRQLARRGDVSRETLVRLAAADAFRSLGLNRRQALWHILALDDAEPPLFAEWEPDEPAIDLPEMALDETVVEDYDALGFSLKAHPIGLVRRELEAIGLNSRHQGTEARSHEGNVAAGLRPGRRHQLKNGATNVAAGAPAGRRSRNTPRHRANQAQPLRIRRAAELKDMRNGQPVAVAGLVTVRQRPGTAKGLVFMTLEDETGTANLVIRPNIWKRDRRIARSKVALIAEGHIERQEAVVNVQVRRFHDLSQLLGDLRHRSRDFH